MLCKTTLSFFVTEAEREDAPILMTLSRNKFILVSEVNTVSQAI